MMADYRHYANSPSNVTMENMFIYRKPNSNHRKGSGACCQLNSYMKYPASSSYHLTRLVFMKTSSPRTFSAFLALATARRCSLATGGTFSNSRASLQFTATLTTMLLTRDTRKGDLHSNGLCRFSLIWQWYAMPTSDTTGCFQKYISTCYIVMSVHIIWHTNISRNVAQ